MRKLSAEEKALWQKVVQSVRPLDRTASSPSAQSGKAPEPGPPTPAPAAPIRLKPAPPKPRAQPGTTLDSSWDRRLSRGLVPPDRMVDLHGHNLATAYDLLDRRLEQAIASGARLMLLITGKPPTGEGRPGDRGAIRAAVGDWLAVSRHAGDIAAVRNAHPRHGGVGALYIVLRRRREPS